MADKKKLPSLLDIIGTPIEFREELDKVGINARTVAEEFKAELNATEIKVHCDKEGNWSYSEPLVAWNIRQKAAENSANALGLNPPEIRGDTLINIYQQQNIQVLSPVIQKLIKQDTAALEWKDGEWKDDEKIST